MARRASCPTATVSETGSHRPRRRIVALLDALKTRRRPSPASIGVRDGHIVTGAVEERCKADGLRRLSGYMIGSQSKTARCPCTPEKAKRVVVSGLLRDRAMVDEGLRKIRNDFRSLIWSPMLTQWHFDDRNLLKRSATASGQSRITSRRWSTNFIMAAWALPRVMKRNTTTHLEKRGRASARHHCTHDYNGGREESATEKQKRSAPTSRRRPLTPNDVLGQVIPSHDQRRVVQQSATGSTERRAFAEGDYRR